MSINAQEEEGMTGQQYSVIIKTKYATTSTLTSTAMKRNENGAAHTHTHTDALELNSRRKISKLASEVAKTTFHTELLLSLSLSYCLWNLRKCLNLLLKKNPASITSLKFSIEAAANEAEPCQMRANSARERERDSAKIPIQVPRKIPQKKGKNTTTTTRTTTKNRLQEIA